MPDVVVVQPDIIEIFDTSDAPTEDEDGNFGMVVRAALSWRNVLWRNRRERCTGCNHLGFRGEECILCGRTVLG